MSGLSDSGTLPKGLAVALNLLTHTKLMISLFCIFSSLLVYWDSHRIV